MKPTTVYINYSQPVSAIPQWLSSGHIQIPTFALENPNYGNINKLTDRVYLTVCGVFINRPTTLNGT